MKTLKVLAGVIILLAMMITTVMLVSTTSDKRSVGPLKLVKKVPPSTRFVRAESTGLFVGVRNFAHDRTLTVPYAVDDAVDLAHKLSLGPRTSLIPPRRVVLALSGRPQKDESQRRLRELKDAGARVERATSGDIHNLLKEQVAQTGPNGLIVLSLATHGFIDESGDPYILGSTSTIGSRDTSLRTALALDMAGQALRSLIFIDACRDRIGQTSRGTGPDPTTAAPLIRKMGRVRGQVVFYAAAPGQYAYDDPVHQNGVFTKAVLDGLSCEASAPRGEVLASTLHTFVDAAVRRWMKRNGKPPANPATQVSMEGETRNMPLAECWRRGGRCSRVSVDGSTITVYDDQTRPLWRKDFRERVVHAEVTDLDADAFCEVVIGLRNRLTALDRDGHPLWSKGGDAMTLRSFTTGDLFRKHTNQIVALWSDERISRLTVIDSAGEELSYYEQDGALQHVAVGRRTNMHAPKIAVTIANSLFLLDPKKLATGAPLWRQMLVSPGDTIKKLQILDADNDLRRDIVVSTKNGTTLFDFEGVILRQRHALWRNEPRSRRSNADQDHAQNQ